MPHHIARDGTRLFYRALGKGGPPLIFVHGWCSNASDWDAQLRHFSRRHRVLAPDRRGHGRSDTPSEGYSATQHAEDLAGILRAERIRSGILIGHAGGVPSCLQLAVTAPSRVKALVLIDSRIGGRADLDDPADPAGAAYRGMVDAIRGPDGSRAFRRMYSELFSRHAGAAGKRALAEACRVPREIAAAELASLAVDTLGLAREIRKPVLWISAGRADEGEISAAFSQVQFGQTVGSGHFPQLEVPEQVNAMLRRFIATL